MDMHIPHALLQVAQEPRPYRSASGPDYFFSEQLSASYQAANHALWIRWTPSPRPSFNPEVLRSLDRCAQFIRAGDGFIRADDDPIRDGEDSADAQATAMPIEYTVLSSGVPGVFNLGGDLDLFLRLIEARNRAGLVAYGTACIHVLYQNYMRARPADHDDLPGPGRLSGRRVRGRAVQRHRGRREACPLRFPRDPVQSVSGYGRLFLPGPARRPARHGRASFDWKNILGR